MVGPNLDVFLAPLVVTWFCDMARDMAIGSYWNIDSNIFDCNDGEITPNCVAVLEKALDLISVTM